MPSPFPGMDPYLEPSQNDVISSLSVYTSRELNRVRPSHLVAHLTRDTVPWTARPRWEAEPYHAVHIAPTSQLDRPITIVEFCKCAKDRTPDERLTIGRQRLNSGRAARTLIWVNLFSITHEWLRLVSPQAFEEAPSTRWIVRHEALNGDHDQTTSGDEIRWLPLREALPTIDVPFGPDVPVGQVNLQGLLNMAYDDGGHESINYRTPLEPALNDDDEKWANSLLKTAKKR